MLPIVMRSMNTSRSLWLMVDGDGDGGDGGSGLISAASGRGCCVTTFFSTTSVANLIWGPSRKLLVSRRQRRWCLVRSRGTGGWRGARPVPCHPGLRLFSSAAPLTWCRWQLANQPSMLRFRSRKVHNYKKDIKTNRFTIFAIISD